MAEPQPLPEIAKDFHQPKGGQEFGHLFIPGILKPTDVRIQVPHGNGVPPWEAVERLL